MSALKYDIIGADSECPTKHYFAAIASFVIAPVGIIANSVAIFIIVTLKEYTQSVNKLYMMNLAIADFILLSFVFFTARATLLGEWPYGMVWCKMSEAVKMLNFYSSVGFLTALSIDRYMAINLAMNHRARTLRTTKNAWIASACIWCVAIAGAINILVYAEVHQCECAIYFPAHGSPEDKGDNGTHTSNNSLLHTDKRIPDEFQQEHGNIPSCNFPTDHVSDYFRAWIACNFLFAFLLPYLVMLTSCTITLRQLKRPLTVGTRSRTENADTKRVTKMVIGLGIAFIICWLPYHAFNLARLSGIGLHADICNSVINCTIVMAYCNSVINPIFYIFLSNTFRERLTNAFEKVRSRAHQCIPRRSVQKQTNNRGTHMRTIQL